jgi:hypothetical protein
MRWAYGERMGQAVWVVTQETAYEGGSVIGVAADEEAGKHVAERDARSDGGGGLSWKPLGNAGWTTMKDLSDHDWYTVKVWKVEA